MERDALLEMVNEMLKDILQREPEYFLVKSKVKPTNNIKVYLDGDNGINIDKCIQINKLLRAEIEEKGLFPEGDYSLEVSSPGIDEPLSSVRQYKKNAGRNVEVSFTDEGRKEKVGKLLKVEEDSIFLEEKTGKGKNEKREELKIPFSEIKKTIVQIKF